jgi:FkbM family methyltransferase
MKTLNFNENQKTTYCIDIALRDEQIKINCQKVKGRIEPGDETDEPIACVSFGPSLKDTWKELKKFKKIITCSGAYKFLIEKGIVPTYHCDLDPREHKMTMLGKPNKKTEFLIASTIHPKYLDALKGYNVKLWHIFATDEEAVRVLPKGEWSLSGGSSVGLRTLTIARFLGYKNIHVFGMDGSFSNGDSHTTLHPNKPKEGYEVEYDGVRYMTTPSMLHVAKETPKEVDSLGDCTVKFYGEGLVQNIMKKHISRPKKDSLIAFNKPTLISDELRELNRKLHQDNPKYGMGGARHIESVLKLCKLDSIKLIGDYGAGKGFLAKELLKHNIVILEYDPAVPGKEELLPPVDLLVCTDVLEHIEPDKLDFVLDDMKRCCKQVGYLVISTRKAVKTYADGRNAHLIVKDKDWWEKQLSKYFTIGTIIHKEDVQELHVVVGPKTTTAKGTMEYTTVEKDEFKLKFYIPNEITKWRAQTVFTKEPITVEWIKAMKPGEILWDIGANVGSYSVMAGSKGVSVYSFEPESQNYQMLIKNLNLNKIAPNAYCIAISNENKFGTLFAGQDSIGGACHTFDKPVGPYLELRQSIFEQGCISFRLDDIKLPPPDHIKIDVDGLEHQVIEGGINTLKNAKSILIEINTNLPEHQKLVEIICSLGYSFNPLQVERAIRKEGTFKGCAEYVFLKEQDTTASWVANKVKEAVLHTEPFPYLVIDNFLPHELYQALINKLPADYDPIEKTRGTRGYPKRFTAPIPDIEEWKEVTDGLLNGQFKRALEAKFGIKKKTVQDLLLIRDLPGYQITPHTDTPAKVLTGLFYLTSSNKKGAGTNIYVPKKKGFSCKKGIHYDFERFKIHKKVEYAPNTLLLFLRTDNSFHGVEASEITRNVLLYNLRTK